MPKHTFKFPHDVVIAVKSHVRRAVEGLSAARFRQEPNYTAALLGRLIGTAYDGPAGKVVFTSTVFDDRAAGSAEHVFGADYAITATISQGVRTIEKVIMVQAKLGHIEDLTTSQAASLETQLRKMKEIVAAPKIMEIPTIDGRRVPSIISGKRILAGEPYTPMELPEYFAARVTTTLDGCTNPTIVAAVEDSSLSRLRVSAKLRA